MAFWDFKRSAASVGLIVAYGRELGLSPAALLRGSGIAQVQLTDPNVEVTALKELKVTSNLLRLSGAPARLGLALGLPGGRGADVAAPSDEIRRCELRSQQEPAAAHYSMT